MKWLIVVVATIAGITASGFIFPEEARGESRIVSGWPASEGQLPHQISLRRVLYIGGNVTGCGGTIIHNRWALTAAHCTAQATTMVVRLGATSLTRPSLIFESKDYYNHPRYNENFPSIAQADDIGVVKFPFSVEYNAVIQPIRLQRSEDRNKNYDGVRMIASGWGALWTEWYSPEVLHWVFLRGVSNKFCQEAFNTSSLPDVTICASGYNVSSQSTCQGDSGGPLTISDLDGKLTQVGITSFVSDDGCHVDIPAGFVRPGHYHSWLEQVTGINFDWDWPASTTPAEPSTEEPSASTTAAPATEESSEEDASSPDGEDSYEENSSSSDEEHSSSSDEEHSSSSNEEHSSSSDEEHSSSSEEHSSSSDEEHSSSSNEDHSSSSDEEHSSNSNEEHSPNSDENSSSSNGEDSPNVSAEVPVQSNEDNYLV